MNKYKNIILDRDGVLNSLVMSETASKGRAPRDLSEIKFPDELNIIKREVSRYNVVVVTNQPDVETGAMSKEVALAIHSKVMDEYNVKNSIMCTHKEKACTCRKPETGMVEFASGIFEMKKQETVFIGDRWTDILCGQNWGCDTILLTPSLTESMKPTEAGVRPPNRLTPTFYAKNWRQIFSILDGSII